MNQTNLDNRDVLRRCLLGASLAVVSVGAVQAHDYYVATNHPHSAQYERVRKSKFLSVKVKSCCSEGGSPSSLGRKPQSLERKN